MKNLSEYDFGMELYQWHQGLESPVYKMAQLICSSAEKGVPAEIPAELLADSIAALREFQRTVTNDLSDELLNRFCGIDEGQKQADFPDANF